MTLSEILPLFDGRKSELAKALGISKQAVSGWPDDAPIPEKQELRLRYEIIPAMTSSKRKKVVG